MAVRSATRRYPDVPAFLDDYVRTLRVGAVFLPAGTVEGEPAPEMKIDLVVPPLGRVGPIVTQLLQAMPDGSIALRIDTSPPELATLLANAEKLVADVKASLLAKGEVLPPSAEIAARIAALEAKIAELEARPPQTVVVSGSGGGTPGQATAQAATRGLLLPDVRGMPPVAEGRLGDRSLRDALMEVAVQRATGLLSVEEPDGRRRWGLFAKGGPVGWRAEPIDEAEVLGILLFRANQLSKEQLAESLQRMDATGQRQGECLIEMGVFGFAQLVMLLQKQAEFVLQRVLAIRSGRWTWHPVEALPERYVNPPIRTASLLYRQMKMSAKEMPAEDLATALRPWLDRYVYVRAGADRVLEEMRLSVEEQQFVRIMTATSYRLRELFTVSNLSRSVTGSTVWCFADLGLLEFRDTEAQERSDERLARMVTARKSAIEMNYFDRLDVHWICTREDVRVAFDKVWADFSPERVQAWPEQHRKVGEKISAALKEAYDTLIDDTKRREYRATVIERPMIVQSAFMLAEKGDMAFMKDSAREAIYCYSKAAELVPNDARYREGLHRANQLGRK